MYKYCAHYISTLSRCWPPSDYLSLNTPSAQCMPRAEGMAGNALHPSRLHQSPTFNCANCEIFLNLLVLLAGDTQPFLKEAQPREQAVVRRAVRRRPSMAHWHSQASRSCPVNKLPSEQDLQANYLMVAGDQILNASPWDCDTTKTLFSCFLLHQCEVFQTATRNINSQKPSWGTHSSCKELWQTVNPGKSQARKSFIKLEAKNGGTRVILFNVSALQRSSFKCHNSIIF